MANFLATLDYLSKHDSDYDTLYQFIVDYESSVADDSSFGSTDRQMIFTATSIARFDYYFASQHKGKPPRDRDWDANIGNIAAALSGSQQSTAQAVSMSVAASIYRNR